ncbi:hypothetical protein ING2E5B_0665 [Fermentimonas caenicola]|jgi:hypothetical protein|uniref:SatD family (SatD) n=1 Tax=Fermentimonas caenicola TaxID=1562970 RepID=A0A098C0J1_9BACT|nr:MULTISPECIES: hypothetical protein [Lascolabacillus]MBP6176491.1 hypothetical protein [Fermentimonas sp.]TAH61699.1 MAG: hypothetical protein EWM46_04725 [Fermentimonas caenicola]MBP7105393.1 hypothetical protein [Fermentimonas sp.]MCK9500835.1 SatD family protein [Lascolabacillus sp.]MDD2608050.1 hypothetical protein [Lascolabacillus sp.]
MIAVITGDIIASRKVLNQDEWLVPLKSLLNEWGKRPGDWDLERGDFFQLEVKNPEDALKRALEIKALIKKVVPLDVRMAIGIGVKTYSGESISESNGEAFIYSGEKFDMLDKENITLGIRSSFGDFDEEMNLYLKLAGTFMNKWTVPSAELMEIVLRNPDVTQEEIGKRLGIKQNSVSGRWNRAYVNEILEVERMYRKKIKKLLG